MYIACLSGMAKGYEEILMGYGARSRVQSTERGSSMCRERNSGADEKRDEEKRKRRSQVRIFPEFSTISEAGGDLSPPETRWC